jgi:hypothetical protein
VETSPGGWFVVLSLLVESVFIPLQYRDSNILFQLLFNIA